MTSTESPTIGNLPARQVHLDFHTSEKIRSIGSRFSRKQFQKALKLGRVNSITVFAKCHHGWSYYPTRVKGARRHPHLQFDLLGEQIRAAHEIGVRAPIYITVGWSANDARLHPDWVVRKPDGSVESANVDPGAKPGDSRPAISWSFLDPTGAYKRLIIEQTAELCSRYPVDGFFYDICAGPVTLAPDAFKAIGLDPDNPADVIEFRTRRWEEFMSDVVGTIRRQHPRSSIFFNGTAGIETDPRLLAHQTHFELEDLPSTWGGYDKFPLRAKLFAEQRPLKQMVAMSGKFHTTWGEFGGFKHPDAMRFEVAGMIGWGARCSFGDQLHPSGEMDVETYRLIGEAFAEVERIEEFGIDSTPCANLGLLVARDPVQPSPAHEHAQGVANMLLETHRDFRVLRDAEQDLSAFETIILPGDRFLDLPTARRLNEYVANGGSLLALGESALHRKENRLLLNAGARFLGPASFEFDYTAIGSALSENCVRSPFFNYESAARYAPGSGRALARIHEPYFNRTYGTYCSHQNTPNRPTPAKHAAAIRKGRMLLLPHSLGRIYYRHGAFMHRQFFLNALRLLHKRPLVEAQLPSAGRLNVLHQPQHKRFVIHLLYGPPLQRGRCLVIEDLPAIYDVRLTLRLPAKIRRIHLPLDRRSLRFKPAAGNAIETIVPRVERHQIVVVDCD